MNGLVGFGLYSVLVVPLAGNIQIHTSFFFFLCFIALHHTDYNVRSTYALSCLLSVRICAFATSCALLSYSRKDSVWEICA